MGFPEGHRWSWTNRDGVWDVLRTRVDEIDDTDFEHILSRTTLTELRFESWPIHQLPWFNRLATALLRTTQGCKEVKELVGVLLEYYFGNRTKFFTGQSQPQFNHVRNIVTRVTNILPPELIAEIHDELRWNIIPKKDDDDVHKLEEQTELIILLQKHLQQVYKAQQAETDTTLDADSWNLVTEYVAGAMLVPLGKNLIQAENEAANQESKEQDITQQNEDIAQPNEEMDDEDVEREHMQRVMQSERRSLFAKIEQQERNPSGKRKSGKSFLHQLKRHNQKIQRIAQTDDEIQRQIFSVAKQQEREKRRNT